MGKKKGLYYEILGKSGKERYKLGFTGSKAVATKYYVEQGWKKKDLVFIPKMMKKMKPPKKRSKKNNPRKKRKRWRGRKPNAGMRKRPNS